MARAARSTNYGARPLILECVPDQILREGERFATADDWADVYDEDAPAGQVPAPPAVFEGIGAQYLIHVRRDGYYLVTYLPGGGREAGYATVVVHARTTWRDAMDTVRDAVQLELDREAARPL